MIEKWEYREEVIHSVTVQGPNLAAILNPIGNDGWEVIKIIELSSGYLWSTDLMVILKRKIP